MNVLIICDRKSTGEQNIRDALKSVLKKDGHKVFSIIANREEIRPCIGCFGCWLKTPGLCVITNDSANGISKRAVRSDAVILVSEITYGGFSSDIKAVMDRFIPNLLPFFEIYKSEMHHTLRYQLPTWISIGYGDVSEDEKISFSKLAERNALNMRPPKSLALTVRDGNELTEKSKDLLAALREDDMKGKRTGRKNHRLGGNNKVGSNG